jgi:uncharacterized protein YcbX
MELSAINIYPVKSLGGISLSEAVVEDRGLRFDRRWMLVDENWKFFTQREFPVMATIHPEIYNGGVRVRKGVEWMEVPGEPDKGEYGVAAIWASRVDVVAYAGAVSEWFSDSIGTKCRLVMMPGSSRRPVNEKYAVRPGEDVVSLADGYPFMLLGEASLADVNSKLDEPVPMNRFRPNFVVTGNDAFEEDGWRKIRIGETAFYVVKPCERCTIPTVDQVTGKKGKEPLKTLASYRTVEGKVLFGQNLIAEAPGATIAVGDNIEVLDVK